MPNRRRRANLAGAVRIDFAGDGDEEGVGVG
jgi:hypothetical protein